MRRLGGLSARVVLRRRGGRRRVMFDRFRASRIVIALRRWSRVLLGSRAVVMLRGRVMLGLLSAIRIIIAPRRGRFLLGRMLGTACSLFPARAVV